MKNVNLKSGYSIIEIIIYVAVFAIISIIVANAFVVLLSFFNQSRTNHDLLQNGNTALERMSHEIRIASAVKGTSVFNTSPGTLELDSLDSGGTAQVIKFSVSNGALNISKDGTVIDNLLGDNIKVTSLIFRNVDTTNSKVVKIEMTLQDSRDKTASNEYFYNIVVLPKEISGTGSSSGSTSKVSFAYSGIHAGTGGFQIVPGETYTGSVYSEGSILNVGGLADTNVTGDAVSGGTSGSFDNNGTGNFIFGGDVSAHTVNKTTTSGTIYCQSGTGNNKACTNRTDTIVTAIPDLSTKISALKAEAEAGGICNTSYPTSPLGPCKIVGNFDFYYDLELTGVLYVTGNINMRQSKKVKLASTYGNVDEAIISDGKIIMGTTIYDAPLVFEGSGTSGSNIFVVSTMTTDIYNSSMELTHLEGDVLFYALNGKITVGSINKLKGLIGKYIQLGDGHNVSTEFITGVSYLNFEPLTFSVTP